MTARISEPLSVASICTFLLDYSIALFGAGSTCIRLEKNIGRMACALGVRADITIMPRHIHLTVCNKTGDSATRLATVGSPHIDFEANTRLSALSWELADGKIQFEECSRKLQQIVRGRHRINSWLLIALVGGANASFCWLFGGDLTAMTIVAIATMAGFRLRMLMLGSGIDIRVIMMVCAFVSTVLGATDMLFSIGDTPAITIGTSVLYLVPGIPFLNSFSDMLYRHYICAFCRLTDALMLTCCLSVGLCAGMALMNAGMF